jgi:hypothetical protein
MTPSSSDRPALACEGLSSAGEDRFMGLALSMLAVEESPATNMSRAVAELRRALVPPGGAVVYVECSRGVLNR